MKKVPDLEKWAELPYRCRPSRALVAETDDPARPYLQCGHVRHEKGKAWLYVTNSYLLVRLPITLPPPKKDAKKFLPPGPISRAALEAIEASGRHFRITDGRVEVGGVLYPRPDEMIVPDFRQMIKGWREAEENRNGGLPKVGFNAEFLARVIDALGGAGHHGARLELIAPNKPIRVRALAPASSEGEAWIMPIRLAEE